MKKVLVFLVLLIILSGTVFFFGWAQFPAPPGSYGVLRSKTHGIDPAVIREGEFRWVWQKLIPTNASTLIFRPNHVNLPVSAGGTLPLAAAYAEKTGIAADFSYSIEADLSFSLKPDSLPSLVLTRGISDQASLEDYEKSLAREIDFFARERLEAYAAREQISGELKPYEGLRAASARLEGEIGRAFPDVENLSCLIRSARLPDYALYATARSLYGEYLNRQKELLGAELALRTEQSVNALLRFDELEKYGELLTKYPVLLQYLELIGSERP
ncbi:MAG: hypothetical protein LBG14_00785 [Treponema sp.]|jgi:hypothetical protein|nr:hypothetical protein [Treponema sp.]